jgi:hypothetical protein
VIQRSIVLVAALLAAACGGHSAPAATAPTASADHVVQEFMRAVADSNLAKMAELWGSAKGSAAATHEPSGYQQRVVIMQAYLRGARYRILSDTPDAGQADRRTLQVELTRDRCVKIVPFGVIRAGGQWLINQLDLSAAGSPGRACDGAAQTSP